MPIKQQALGRSLISGHEFYSKSENAHDHEEGLFTESAVLKVALDRSLLKAGNAFLAKKVLSSY